MQRASVRSYGQALAALVHEVSAIVGAPTRVSCMSLDQHELVYGDAPPDDVRMLARRAAWGGEQVVRRPGLQVGGDRRASSIALVPVAAELPGSQEIGT